MDEPTEPSVPTESRTSRPAYFPVSCNKLVVLSICTLGLYQMYWAWNCWESIRIRDGKRFNSAWRSVLITMVLFNFLLFWDVFRHTGSSKPSAFAWSLVLGLVYIVCFVFSYIEDEGWVAVGLLSCFAYVPVQRRINRFNAREHPGHDPNARYSKWNVAAVLVLGPLVVLAVIGGFLMES